MELVELLIVGAYGYGNIGDEAVLDGILLIFGKENVVVCSFSPKDTEKMHKVKAIKQSQFSTKHPALMLGGGTLASDIHEKYFKWLLQYVKKGKKTVIYSIGCDYYKSYLISIAIKLADNVSVRTKTDLEILKRKGIIRPIEIVPDPSFIIPPQEIPDLTIKENTVGIGVTGIRPPYPKRLVTLIKELKKDYNIIPVVSCIHRNNLRERDDITTKNLFELCGIKFESKYVKLWHPRQLKWIISQLTHLYTMRKHPMMMALSTNVPVTVLSCSESSTTRTAKDYGVEIIRLDEARKGIISKNFLREEVL